MRDIFDRATFIFNSSNHTLKLLSTYSVSLSYEVVIQAGVTIRVGGICYSFCGSKTGDGLRADTVLKTILSTTQYVRYSRVLIKAVMMQESGGRGSDPMQSSEFFFDWGNDGQADHVGFKSSSYIYLEAGRPVKRVWI